MRVGSLHLALLRAEVAAARIEALTRAEPEVGRLWRTEAALLEAVASVGLEDVRLSVPDLVARLAMNRTEAIDARGVELAQQILGVLRAPGDILADPVAVVRRIERAAAPIGDPVPEADRVGDEAIAALVAGLEQFAEMPVAGALSAVAGYAQASGRRAPAAERLVFVAVEGALRGGAWGRPRDAEAGPSLLVPVAVGWVVTPSVALTRRGFALWSPLRAGGIAAFLALVADSLAWDLGHLGRLRAEVARLKAAGQRRHGRSRLGDMAGLVLARPVFTSALVADALGVTRRTALNLIGTLEEQGLVRPLVPRRAARIWATATLAERMRVRAAPAAAARAGVAAAGEGAATVASVDTDATAFSRTLADLDRAIAEAEGLLQRRGR